MPFERQAERERESRRSGPQGYRGAGDNGIVITRVCGRHRLAITITHVCFLGHLGGA